MDLSIIIPSFNTKELLRQCLRSVISDQWSVVSKKPVTEIIVVDNGSTDSSVEMLKKLQTSKKPATRDSFGMPKLQVFFNKENLGFAKAVNRGIKKAKGEYILLLNSDIIVQPGALKAMVDFAKTHLLVGVVGGRLLDPDGSVQASVYHFPSLIRAIREFWFNQKDTYQKYTPHSDQPVVVDAVTGSTMLIPKKIIDEIGLLDERYFMYFEDLDYCRRVKKAGYKTYYLPSAQFAHYHGASGEKIPELTHQWLVESSKLYNGFLKYYLLTLIIWLGQKWQRLLKRK